MSRSEESYVLCLPLHVSFLNGKRPQSVLGKFFKLGKALSVFSKTEGLGWWTLANVQSVRVAFEHLSHIHQRDTRTGLRVFANRRRQPLRISCAYYRNKVQFSGQVDVYGRSFISILAWSSGKTVFLICIEPSPRPNGTGRPFWSHCELGTRCCRPLVLR